MLIHENNRSYYVYPSWAETGYAWKELSDLLSNPLKSGCFEPEFNPRNYGYPDNLQLFDLEDGPRGGGIIVVHSNMKERWLGSIVLCRNADIRMPDAVLSMQGGTFNSDIAYIDPYESTSIFAGVKTQRIHICGVSPEHLKSAGNSVYWVLGHSHSKVELPELREVTSVGRGYGLDVEYIGSMPSEVKAEAEPLFFNQPMNYLWFRINGPSNSAGHHFAWLIYVAFYMKSIIGKKMHVMHLCADIEGLPRARQYWVSRIPRSSSKGNMP